MEIVFDRSMELRRGVLEDLMIDEIEAEDGREMNGLLSAFILQHFQHL
jgi:hypothetical protein